MSIMESIPATLAVVLVNFDDTFRLSEKFVSGEGESPPVPVILVTNETGSRLARLLEENPRDVKAVVHTQSRETASPSLISDPQPCECFKIYFFEHINFTKPLYYTCVLRTEYKFYEAS